MLNYIYNDPDSKDDPWMFSAEDQYWDQDTLKQLRDEYNIIFKPNGKTSVHPIMIIPRKNESALFVIGVEDDGTLYFKRSCGQFINAFDSGWTYHIICELMNAKNLEKTLIKIENDKNC